MSGVMMLLLAAGGDKPFDEDAVKWQDRTDLMRASLREAGAFRDEVLESRAGLLSAAMREFRSASREALNGRPGLDNFPLSEERFLRQIRGKTELSAEDVFGPFTGRWYGEWDGRAVDHHWHPVGEDGVQYAWIGDGFGWNYVADSVILGYVCHVQEHEPATIIRRTPHLGYAAGPKKLLWITGDHVFFEEVFGDRYAITGFRYRVEDGKLTNVGDGFQAIYTRKPDDRPKYFRFPLRLEVSRK